MRNHELMSYDIEVSFSEWPDDALKAWRGELAKMGVAVDFHPNFEVDDYDGWLPLVMRVTDASLFDDADILLQAGEHLTGFGYYSEADRAAFTCKRLEGNAAGLICAAALAAITRGELEDPQLGDSFSGKTGRAVMSKLSQHPRFELETPEEPVPFESWDDVEVADDDEDEDEDDDD